MRHWIVQDVVFIGCCVNSRHFVVAVGKVSIVCLHTFGNLVPRALFITRVSGKYRKRVNSRFLIGLKLRHTVNVTATSRQETRRYFRIFKKNT